MCVKAACKIFVKLTPGTTVGLRGSTQGRAVRRGYVRRGFKGASYIACVCQ
jgi:hypothetical protein